jgi:poly(3-hydroxybutyrate) depolymerase
MNGSTYPADGANLVNQLVINGTFNTVAFRTNFPCIVVVPECDQTLDLSGANGNANFGGYADTPNSGGNEQAINALLTQFKANFSVDPTRCYCIGDSLGAIGSLAWIVDNNRVNGVNKLWTAAWGNSDQLFRPSGVPNATVFANMRTVPYIAVSTPNDNNQAIYDQAGWTFYTGNTNYPTPAQYAASGVAAMKAGTNSFWYMLDPTGVPWDTYRQLNADGGQATALYNLLFSFII